MTVDEILATGRYEARDGQRWFRSTTRENRWVGLFTEDEFNEDPQKTDAQMRLLIERDLHREECRGVRECQYHPVPRVFEYRGQFGRWSVLAAGADPSSDTARNNLIDAMNAARALAVGE